MTVTYTERDDRSRNWEQGRTEPDQANRAYHKVIAVDPEFVKRALAQPPGWKR